jgi:predicted transcriptional regulator
LTQKDPLPIPTGRILTLNASDSNSEELQLVTKALGANTRLEILRFLGSHTCSVMEIAEALELPQSTATLHINILEKAGLIKTDLRPSTRGLQKLCARVYDQVIVQLPIEVSDAGKMVSVEMPIGAYVDAEVFPTCGLAGEIGIIGHLDDPGVFFEPDHLFAQLLWFKRGYVEYRFPQKLPSGSILDSMEISFEVCSEAPLHHPDWPSDITLWVDNVEVGTWTSPADFGGERGALTPSWWDDTNSQFGLMKVWKITSKGSFVDGVRISDVGLSDITTKQKTSISVRIGIKENAQNVGGINLFGKKFGNYPQDIILKQRFHFANDMITG